MLTDQIILRKFPILLMLLFSSVLARAQDYETLNERIDSLTAAGLPKSALKEVAELEMLARNNGDAEQIIRASIYRITLLSYMNEEATVPVISTLKEDIQKSAFPVKPVLQSLLAEMYWKYYEENRWKIIQRQRIEKPGPDFTRWDLHTIISEITNLYQRSLEDEKNLQRTPISALQNVLRGDTTTRNLRPALYDLLLHRALDFFLNEEPELRKPKLPFTLNDPRFLGTCRDFIKIPLVTTDSSSTVYLGITNLQKALAFHLTRNDSEAVADLDLRRLQFLYRKLSVPHKDSLYIHAILQTAKDYTNKPLSTDALLLAGQYYMNKDSLQKAHEYFKQAVLSYPSSIGAKNAALLMQQIEYREVQVTTEQTNIAGKPLLALMTYKNVKDASVKIYKLSVNCLNQYKKLYTKAEAGYYLNNGIHPAGNALLKFLKGQQEVQRLTLQLPATEDYGRHSTEFKIDALDAGRYVLLVSSTNEDSSLIQLSDFVVSRLAYVTRKLPNSSIEVRVMDRETGEPLINVNVHVKGELYNRNWKPGLPRYIYTTAQGTTDKNGMFRTSRVSYSRFDLRLSYAKDTLTGKSESTFEPESIVSTPSERTILFTDRQVYRPGQTIYFKGIQLQTIGGKSKIIPEKQIQTSFVDGNNRLIRSDVIKTNDYGTFSGSFIIPRTLLNGNVRLRTPDGELTVRVEEYKRPAFRIEFNPVKGTYKPNDSVIIKGRVSAFAGYGLAGARVAYRITRSVNWTKTEVDSYKYSEYPSFLRNIEVGIDTVSTDDQGNYSIPFRASSEEQVKGVVYNYEISCDVTDASGETHSESVDINVGDPAVNLTATIPDILIAKDSVQFYAELTTLNGQRLPGRIKAEIFTLRQPSHLLKKKLWEKPDQFILSPDSYKKLFPDYAYENEDNYNRWIENEKTAEAEVPSDTANTTKIILTSMQNRPSGVYKLKIHGETTTGDTISTVVYFKYINPHSDNYVYSEEVLPVRTDVYPGEKAKFIAGSGSRSHILMEHYEGTRLVSSGWLDIKSQQSIEVPVSDNANTSVRFLMICQNRLYENYYRISLTQKDKQLNVRLTTFRNQLEPGQKEQWKLQITNYKNEQQAAEVIAALYDASLDDIYFSQKWNILPAAEMPVVYAWDNTPFTFEAQTEALQAKWTNYTLRERFYEGINLFGYNYDGGYNYSYDRYKEYIGNRATRKVQDRKLEAEYIKNAALVKKGRIVEGKVLDSYDRIALQGVLVSIRGTKIATRTNSRGYFKIKVPLNGILRFNLSGYFPMEISPSETVKKQFWLKPDESALPGSYPEAFDKVADDNITGMRFVPPAIAGARRPVAEDLKIADPGVKTIAGDPNAEIVLHEPAKFAPPAPIARSPRVPLQRKNFNETAFFYPQLHTDENGQALIDFTIPEALTTWRFKALAHTRDLAQGYTEENVITRKQLMVSANMPRFFREGDTITISAKVANLSDHTINARVNLTIFNAVDGKPVCLLADSSQREQTLKIGTNTNLAVSFKLIIPSNLHAVTYRIAATTDYHSDGEENTIPVLSDRINVTESLPLIVRPGETRAFEFHRLINNNSNTLINKTLTLEYSSYPSWYAILAMPYLMEFPYECSEQTFSRYFANCLSSAIINSTPNIKHIFDKWQLKNDNAFLSGLEKNPELKNVLLEETPWLQNAATEGEQKKRISQLFNLNKIGNEQAQALERLLRKQLPDGGFPWFGGNLSDRYISQHILAGIGQLYHSKLIELSGPLKTITQKALKYMDARISEDDKGAVKSDAISLSPIEVHAWFTRSFFPKADLSNKLKEIQKNYFNRAEKYWPSENIYHQGMIALTLLRNGKPEVTQRILRSLTERAEQSKESGMYWAKNTQGRLWNQSAIETQSLMIALFTEAGGNERLIDEMKVWLLQNKQTNNWKTTKATAAACYALLLRGSDIASNTNNTFIRIASRPLSELKPDIQADEGSGYFKTSWIDKEIRPELGKTEITNKSSQMSWGALHWQYTEKLDKIVALSADIAVEREYYLLKTDQAGDVLTTVDARYIPKVGDLLKVIIHLKAERDYDYIQLKDMRPAGTEPVDVLSSYKYQDGLYYYQVTKDAVTNFFIDRLNEGTYTFEYRLRVVQPGNYSTGITTVQCMYAPEFNTHSEGKRIRFSR